MRDNVVNIGCSLSADEYKRFKELCAKNGTYPSAAIREAVLEWMEKKEK